MVSANCRTRNNNKFFYRFSSGLTLTLLLCTLIFSTLLSCRSVPSEQPSHYSIGLITNNPNGLKNIHGFRERMAKLGWVEGKNVSYLFAGKPVAKQALQQELEKMVEQNVDLIFTAGTPTGVAAYSATKDSNIPVVFGVIADPLAAGVMKDLTHPGGNITGVMLSKNQARRLELLKELSPSIHRVFTPYNPKDYAPASSMRQIAEIAPGLGLEIVEGHAVNSEQASKLVDELPKDIDAIFMLPDSTVNKHVDKLIANAIERKLPVSGPSTIQVEHGALIAFGIIHEEAGAQAAGIADRILKGSDPGNLPVETAEYYLAINLKTANTIGLEIPDTFIKRAKIVTR